MSGFDVDAEAEMLTYGFSRHYIPGGVLGSLAWQCVTCGALVGEPALHWAWHEDAK